MNQSKSPAAVAMGDALFTEAIITMQRDLGRAILVGISGSQGSGKSTRARAICERIRSKGHHAVVCSLDDFYLTRSERSNLAQEVHPLLETRGVPGTHDIPLMTDVLSALLNADDDSEIATPSFDKTTDERVAREAWHVQKGRADVVILEGWCVGARAESADELSVPINQLERDEDPEGTWRRYVNECLAKQYTALFTRLDLILMLRAPSFEHVHRWRSEQEAGLPRNSPDSQPAMDDAVLARFISHYERITRQMLCETPADIIAYLGDDRVPVAWRCRPPEGVVVDPSFRKATRR